MNELGIQDLLDIEATSANNGNMERRKIAQIVIKLKRQGPPPTCWGYDDCSTSMLSTCPWRIDCGGAESQSYLKQHDWPSY